MSVCPRFVLRGAVLSIILRNLVAGPMFCCCVMAQSTPDVALAKMLADQSTREIATERVLADSKAKIPILLSCTHRPPPGVDRANLNLGMTIVFGRAKTVEAIPFIVEHLDVGLPFDAVTIWNRSPARIEEALPAAVALIQIGPLASKALMEAFRAGKLNGQDRLAAIFVVSRIKGVPEAREFLIAVSGQANVERFWAEEGLKSLGEP